MRYNKSERLRWHADRVSNGVAASQSQESLDEQLKDLHVLAIRFGLYDAGEWLKASLEYIEQYKHDYGFRPSSEEKQEFMNQDDDAEPGVNRYDPERC
jgi:uncharacterized protein (DUF934 family)